MTGAGYSELSARLGIIPWTVASRIERLLKSTGGYQPYSKEISLKLV